MTLTAMQETADWVWQQEPHPPQTTQEALERLHQTIEQAMQAYLADHLVTVQAKIEATLWQCLLACQQLSLDPERALKREASRRLMANSGSERVFYIEPTQVSIWVQGHCRGGWPIFSDEEATAAVRLALDMGCQVIHGDSPASQLTLFTPVTPSNPSESTVSSAMSL